MKAVKEKHIIPENKLSAILISIILPIVIIAIWVIGSKYQWFNQSIIPTPHKMGVQLTKIIADGSLAGHVLASFRRVIYGYIIGVIAGVGLGTLLGLYARLNQAFVLLIGILRPIPPIACIPLFILALGIGENSKIALIFIGAFWPCLLNTIAGIHQADAKLIEVAQIFGKRKLVILKDIIIPSALPSIFTGLRLGISTAWSCVVAAEMIASTKGVGYLIMYAREMSKPALLFIGIIAIGIIGLLIDLLMQLLQRKVIYWESGRGGKHGTGN
jgi:sulfonate transport system permease protein